MPAVKNLMVRAGADFSAITTQASKASQSMRGMQSSVSRSCDVMSKAASGLKKAFGALGIVFSAAALVSFGKAAAEAYDKQVAGEVRLAQVMRNTMGASNAEIQSILDLTSAQQELGVVGDEVQLAGAQELATYLQLTDSLQTLIPVMNDMATQQYGFNVTAEETTSIATMLGKVMQGQTSALSRYGYYFDEAQEAILKYGTEAERAAMLAEVVGQSVGGMNQALAQTPTGRMQQLRNTLSDIKENFGQAVRTIGTVFLPLLNTVANVLAVIANIANKVAQSIATVFGGTVAGKEWQLIPQGASTGVSNTADAVDDLTDSTKKAGKAAKDAHKELQTLSFDTMLIMRDNSSSGDVDDAIATAVSGAYAGTTGLSEVSTAPNEAMEGFGWLEEKLQSLKEKWEEFREKLDLDRLKEGWDALKESLSGFGEIVADKVGYVWDNYLSKLAEWTINEAAPQALETLAAGFQALTDVLEFLDPALNGAIDLLGKGLTLAGQDTISMLEDLEFAFQLISTLIKEGPVAAFDLLKQHTIESAEETWAHWGNFAEWWDEHVVSAIRNWMDTWLEAHPVIGGLMQGVINDTDTLFGNFPQWWTTYVINPIKKWIEQWMEAHPVIKEILDLLGINLSSAVSGGSYAPSYSTGAAAAAASSRTGSSLSSTSSGPTKHSTSSRSSVSWHAEGGIFNRASIIGLGEAGAEAVVPLEHNTGWISKLAAELATQMSSVRGMSSGDVYSSIRSAIYEGLSSAIGNSGGSSREIRFEVNGREFIRATWEDIQAVTAEHGISLITG